MWHVPTPPKRTVISKRKAPPGSKPVYHTTLREEYNKLRASALHICTWNGTNKDIASAGTIEERERKNLRKNAASCSTFLQDLKIVSYWPDPACTMIIWCTCSTTPGERIIQRKVMKRTRGGEVSFITSVRSVCNLCSRCTGNPTPKELPKRKQKKRHTKKDCTRTGEGVRCLVCYSFTSPRPVVSITLWDGIFRGFPSPKVALSQSHSVGSRLSRSSLSFLLPFICCVALPSGGVRCSRMLR